MYWIWRISVNFVMKIVNFRSCITDRSPCDVATAVFNGESNVLNLTNSCGFRECNFPLGENIWNSYWWSFSLKINDFFHNFQNYLDLKKEFNFFQFFNSWLMKKWENLKKISKKIEKNPGEIRVFFVKSGHPGRAIFWAGFFSQNPGKSG